MQPRPISDFLTVADWPANTLNPVMEISMTADPFDAFAKVMATIPLKSKSDPATVKGELHGTWAEFFDAMDKLNGIAGERSENFQVLCEESSFNPAKRFLSVKVGAVIGEKSAPKLEIYLYDDIAVIRPVGSVGPALDADNRYQISQVKKLIADVSRSIAKSFEAMSER